MLDTSHCHFDFIIFLMMKEYSCVCKKKKAVPLIVIGFAEDNNKEVMWGFKSSVDTM